METTTGVTYRRPSLNGPVEPLNPQFYKTQRWNVIQNIDLGKYVSFNNFPILNLNIYPYRKEL